MQEVNHPDHNQEAVNSLNNDSISDTETLLPTLQPTLASEVKAADQHLSVQMFSSALGEPSIPKFQPVQTGVLHTIPNQVC